MERATSHGPPVGGKLTGQHPRNEPLPESARADANAESQFSDKNWQIVETLIDINGRSGQSPASIAINSLSSKPWFATPIFGASRPDQLFETLRGLAEPLPDETRQGLNAAIDHTGGRISREQ